MRRPDQDAQLVRLHRVSIARKQWDDLTVLAFDHRIQFFDLAREVGAAEEQLPKLKRLLVTAVAETEAALGLSGHTGVLIDDLYGQDALNAATGRGWWVGRAIELPLSNPLEFECGRSVGTHLLTWPKEQIVKCLVQFHPDDTVDNRLEQETQIRTLYDAVQVSGHELLLEIIPPKHLPRAADTMYRALKRLYNIDIYPDWWKLEPMPAAQWRAIDGLIAERDPYCRGVVLLGLNASVEELAQGFREARDSSTCRGFVVGRTIFQEPSRAWLAGQIDDQTLVQQIRANFEALIRVWRDVRADRKKEAAA
jgi:5-dehydro-2-deoxygluconokinase